MALTDLEKAFVYDYSSRLLERDMLTNQLFAGSAVGQNLRSLVLGEPVRAATFTNPFEEAISGTLRADAGATRQAARNVGEAASMMGVARTGMATVLHRAERYGGHHRQDQLRRAGRVQFRGPERLQRPARQGSRQPFPGRITTGYPCSTGGQWGTSQIDADGKVFIQSDKSGGFNISFHAVDTPASGVNWSDLSGAALGDAGTRATQLGYVQTLASEMNSIQSMYQSKEDSLQSQELALQSQAQILDNAAQLRKPSDPDYSLEKLLADLIARNSGTIFDGTG